MNKFYDTVQDERGVVLPGYRVQVVTSAGDVVDIFSDRGGTRFTDAAGNTVNYATADGEGLAEFFYTAADGQIAQILKPNGDLFKSIDGFADNFVVENLSGFDTALDAKANAADVPTNAALAATTGAALIGTASGATSQDAADSAATQVVLGTDSDPLISGATFADTEAAEAAYPGARVIRSDGPTIFIRPDEPDGAVNAERYGIVEGDNAATGAENGARLSWLIARGYRGIRHRAAILALHNVEITKRNNLTLFFNTVRNRTSSGDPMFHLNKGVTNSTDNVTRFRINADVLESYGAGGHMFHVEGLLFNCPELINGVRQINSRSATGSIFHFDPDATVPGRSTFVNYHGGEWRMAQASTVAAMFQDADQSSFNNNIVAPGAIYCGQNVPAIQLHSRASSERNRGNIFRLPMEYGNAGALHLTGCDDTEIDVIQFDHDHWSANYQADMIFVGGYDEYVARYPGYAARTHSSPSASNSPRIRRYGKASAMTVGSFYDIYLDRADGFMIDGGAETSYAATRTIEARVRSTSYGTIRSSKNLVVTGFAPEYHTVQDAVAGMKVPALQVNGQQAAGTIVAMADVAGATGTLSQNTGVASVVRTNTGRYTVTLANAIGSNNYQVMVRQRANDTAYKTTKTNGTTFTVEGRTIGSPTAFTDADFGLVVMAGV